MTYIVNRKIKNAHKSARHVPLGLMQMAVVAMTLVIGGIAPTSYAFANSEDVTRAEAMIWGEGGKSSPSTGRLLLEKAAAAGDLSASRVLGLHLVYGWVFEPEVSIGFELLQAASSGGDAEAQNALGQLYLWGNAGRADPVLARRYLEAASAQGNVDAMRTLGRELVTGAHLEKDVDSGLALLKDTASLGDTKALIVLGQLYLDGRDVPPDRKIARTFFEKAAALGDGEGLLKYGEYLMWRQINATAAEQALLQAADAGSTRAYVALANGAMYGYLGGGSVSRRKYAGYAQKANDAGEEHVAVLEAERYLWGIGTRASGPQAIAILTAAAEQGNASAAEYLVALLRDGNGWNVRRSPKAARNALDTYAELFTEKRRGQYDLTLQAAMARTPTAYAPVADAISERSDLKSLWFGKEIYKANPNVAFFVLQRRLAAEGKYRGAVNGYATRQTLRVVYKECLEKLDRDVCNDSVMRPDVIGALLAGP